MLTLPPGLNAPNQAGTLKFSLKIDYLNLQMLPKQNIQLCLEIWGVPSLVPMQSQLSISTCSFITATNRKKLTSYLNDMGVIVVHIVDRRVNKKVGVGYFKIRKYIINGLVSEFVDEQIQFLQVGNKRIIGAGKVSLSISEEEQIIKEQQRRAVENRNPERREQMKREGKKEERYEQSDSVFYGKERRPHLQAEIIEKQQIEKMRVQKNRKKFQKDTTQTVKQEQLPKAKTIDELQTMYGRNNPYLEKMKIKLDQINLLDHHLSFHQEPSTQQANYAIYINYLKPVPPASPSIIAAITQLSITNLVQLPTGEETPSIQISINNMGTLPHNLIYLGKIQLHSILQFESKLYKGRYQVRENMLTGAPKIIFLKKKQNNKKSVEIEMSLRKVEPKQNKEESIEKRLVKKEYHKAGYTKSAKAVNHFYVDIQNLSKQKYSSVLEIKATEREQIKGNKLIFSSQSNTQEIKISNGKVECEVEAREGTILKQEIVSLGQERYLVRIGVSQDLKQLMEVMESSKQKRIEIGKSEDIARCDNQIKRQKINEKQGSESVNRIKKLKYLIRCLQYLSLSHNSQCQAILNKMMENYQQISESEQQMGSKLFEQLCIHAQIPEPSLTTQYCFLELLHGQFTMFWECFLQFHQWNTRYLKSIEKVRKQFFSQLKNKPLANNSEKQMSVRYLRNEQQVERLVKKMLKRLNRRSDILFGLIDKNIAEETLIKFISESLEEGEKQIEQNLKIISEQLLELIVDRYGSNKIKILELQNLLMSWKRPTNLEETTLILNEMQLVRIYENWKNKELLEEVIRSCGIGINKHEEDKQQEMSLKEESKITGKKGRRLPQILLQAQELETSIFETSSEDGYEQEDNGIFRDYRKYVTEQNEEGDWNEANIGVRRKQAIDRSKRNLNNLIEKEGHKFYEHDENGQKLITEVSLPNPKQEALTIILRSFVIGSQAASSYNIKFTNSDSPNQPQKNLTLTPKQLPTAVQLFSDCEYLIDIVAKSQEGKELINCYGLFIMGLTLKSIILYKKIKDEGQQNITVGSIEVGIREYRKQKQEENDEIILEVREDKKKTLVKYECEKEDDEKEEQEIVKQEVDGKKLNGVGRVRYQIVKMYPPVKSGETSQIIIEGVDKIIEYPFNNIVGVIEIQKIKQKGFREGSEQLSIDVIGKGREKIRLTEGLHEVCILAADQTVNCILQIQLLEYFNQELFQDLQKQKEEIFGKFILLNIYHLESLRSLIKHEGNETTEPSLKPQIEGEEINQLQILITTSSKSQPIHSKTIHLHTNHNQADLSCIQTKINHQQIGSTFTHETINLRSIPLNFSVQLSAFDQKYIVTIYKKLDKTKAKNNRSLLACFEFSFKRHLHTQIGVFQNKGYLIDEHGFRLAVNVLQINYNDIFSKDEVGRNKFEKLLSVFQAPNIHKISKQLKKRELLNDNKEQRQLTLKKALQNNFGFSQTEIYILVQLERRKSEFVNLFNYWDVDCLSAQTEDTKPYRINLKNYSLKNLSEEYKLFDFKDDGLLPFSKAQIINKIVISETPIPLTNFLTFSKNDWVIDHHSKESEEYIDYMLILWNLKNQTEFDDFFAMSVSSNDAEIKYKGQGNQNNQTIINVLNEESKFSKKWETEKRVLVRLLEYKNLKINEKAPNLTFYINGQKLAEPKLRSISYKFYQCPQIVTSFPINLQIKNRVYGYSSMLYEEETVAEIKSLKGQKINILGGQVIFEIGDEIEKEQKNKNEKKDRKSEQNEIKQEEEKKVIRDQKKGRSREKHEQRQISMLQSRRTDKSQFRQSRREKWQNLQQSKQKANKIRELLTKSSQN